MVEKRQENGFGTPYEQLYIYLVNGVVRAEDEAVFGERFIGRWIEDGSSFLFFSEPSRRKVDLLLCRRHDLSLLQEHRFTYDEWQGSFLEPLKVENLLIVPPWKDVEAENGSIKVLLDPGVVFGSGLHPTTRDCLKALLRLTSIGHLGSVLDIGTGTGILALAAARLGAEKVAAVDLNPLCVNTAKRNVALNHLEQTIEVMEGKAEDFVGFPSQLVLANIHYDVMRKLMDQIEFQGKRWYILSGLMRSQARDIEARLPARRLKMEQAWDHEATWYTLLIRGKA